MRRVRSLLLLPLVIALGAEALAKEGSQAEDLRNTKVMRVDPFEHVHGHPASLTIKGRMQKGYGFSEAVLVRPDGSAVSVKDVKTTGDRFTVKLRLGRGKGIYRLSITGTTDRERTHHGLRTWLYAGVPEGHPDTPMPEDVKPDKRVPGEVLAVDLFRRVNAHRKSIGEKPLAWHEPLAQAARLHAAECLKRKKLDHKFQGVGTIAWRAQEMFGFQRLIYTRPPDKPTGGPNPRSYVSVVLDARRGLEPVLHRWQREGAICLPMTSPFMTHAACGIARTKGGSVYIAFVFAQLNGKHIRRLTDAVHKAAVREAESRLTLDEERPVRLRELGLWLEKRGAKLAKKHAKADDPALRGAALDVLLLHDPEATRRAIEAALDAAGRAYATLEAGRSPSPDTLLSLMGVAATTYAPDLLDRAAKVETIRREAAGRALKHALGQAQDETAARKALERILVDWPETPAAEDARKRL